MSFNLSPTLGVKHVFMLSGGGAMHLVDSVGRNKKLTYICNLHEQACAIAADAYSQYTNHLGVALVTTGPGGTNTLTGVAGAWLDSTPMLIISGQVKRAGQDRRFRCAADGLSGNQYYRPCLSHHQICRNRHGSGKDTLSSGKGRLSGKARPARPGLD